MYTGYPLLPDLTLKSPIKEICSQSCETFCERHKKCEKVLKNRNDDINTKKFD